MVTTLLTLILLWDVARGRGYCSLAGAAGLIIATLFSSVTIPIALGVLLTLGAAKGLGCRMHLEVGWEPIRLALITTPGESTEQLERRVLTTRV